MTAPTRPLEDRAPFSVFFFVIVVVSFLSVPFQLRAVNTNTCVWRCSTLDFLTSSLPLNGFGETPATLLFHSCFCALEIFFCF